MIKWRPSLWLVTGGALAGTLAASLTGLVVFRYLGEDIGFKNAAVVVGSVIGVATLILWLLMLRLLLRPLAMLTAYSDAVRDQNNAERPEQFGTQEMFRMGSQVIEMATALQNREATVRAYTDHVTHELKTPVSVLRASIELLEDSRVAMTDDLILISQIDHATSQIELQLNALRDVAAAREARYIGVCRTSSILEELKELAGSLELILDDEKADIPISETGILLVLGHLFKNAQMHGAKTLWVTSFASKGDAFIRVENDGSPISDGNQLKVFEPFFTTQREAGGTGMGLSIVASLLKAHGGSIQLNSANPVSFLIAFPK
ncbi:MAG: HAMP domain-containing sensor histidine kinase [Pseudomonadota bacterium]